MALVLAGGVAHAATKPSIVFILTDDMQTELVRHMPHTTALIVEGGATFRRAYFNQPLCCPSRATILTGKYAQNTTVRRNSHQLFYQAGNADRTYAVWLKAAGYRTGHMGKYLNGYPKPAPWSYVPPGWDSWNALSAGTSMYYDYSVSENGVNKRYKYGAENYSTDVYARKALAFVDRAIADQAPFFVQIAPAAAHGPYTPAERHAALFPTLTAPKPPSFNEADVSDKPAYIQGLPPLSATEIATLDSEYRDKARSLQSVDEAIKAIADRLAAAGRLGQTYFVLAADNGVAQGNHRLWYKGLPYEEVIKMTLHIRGPGIRPGLQLYHLVGNVDLASTFAEWAGATVPVELDGRSLAPLLRPNRPTVGAWRHAFPLTSLSEGYSGDKSGNWRGLRTRDYTYVEYATGETELYDNRTDRDQLRNLALTADPLLLMRLARRTAELDACKGGACRRLEDAPL